MRLRRIHHAAIICSNYDVSKRFYTELLGLRIIAEHYRSARNSWKLDLALPDGSQVELFSFPDPPQRPSYPEARGLRHLAFEVDDVDACKAELEAAGVAVEAVRVDEVTNRRFVFFADPDGLPLELYEAAEWPKDAGTPPGLYTASVPMFSHYLDRLDLLVDAAQSTPGLLAARLAPDMLPFHAQVEIAANFSLRACFPLAGERVPAYGEFPCSFAGLHERIARAKSLIGSLDPARFSGREGDVIEDMAGERLVRMPAAEFLHVYAAPNFLFHLATAYGILRAHGVKLGKADFDGLHRYPPA